MNETDGELTAVWLMNPSDATGYPDGTFGDRPIVWDEGVPPGWTRMGHVDRETLDRRIVVRNAGHPPGETAGSTQGRGLTG